MSRLRVLVRGLILVVAFMAAAHVSNNRPLTADEYVLAGIAFALLI